MTAPYTPGYINRPPFLTTEVSLSNTVGQPGATAAILSGAGTLVSALIKSCTPGSMITFFDSATAVTTGTPIQITDGAATPLAAAVSYNYGRPFANGLSVAVSGTVDAIVTYTAG